MKKGQQFLVVRYGTNIVDDCIKKHIDVLSKSGSCWFGKIGTPPSEKNIANIMKYDNPTIILYSKEEAFECEVSEVTSEKPQSNYPEYYDKYIFTDSIAPKKYFKLKSIRKIEKGELREYIVVSSRSPLIDTLNRSMSSFFLAEYPQREKKKSKKESIIQENKIEVNESDGCVFFINGKCTNKSCVNYLYECNRPNMCLKQKKN